MAHVVISEQKYVIKLGVQKKCYLVCVKSVSVFGCRDCSTHKNVSSQGTRELK